ncbi:MAG: acetylxylan esterase [Prevotella sp.]|nr:acetylxylan esterase [Prevotella sp.]
MKKITIIAIMLLNIMAAMAVENYPYRSDFLWVTTPDHADWLYKTGEKANVEVQLFKYGYAQDVKVDYEVAQDMMPASTKGSVKLKNGKAVINIGTRTAPGFTDLVLKATVDGEATQHHVKVGYDVDKILPFTKMPDDFGNFWKQTLDEMHKTPLSYTRELAKEYCTDKIDCWLIRLKIDKEHSMFGYLFMPKDREGKKLPAAFSPPGAGVKTIRFPMRHKYYPEDGFIRLEVEIHGLDPRLSESTFKDITSAFASMDNGYFTNRIDNREAYYLRHVYAGMVRWTDFLCSLPEWDGKNLAVQGGSQGGALALVTAALDPRVTACCVNHPALTDMAAYTDKGRTGGYPHFSPEILTPQVVNVLQYYDVINFCRIVKCPVRMTWGYNDNVCPPTTSYAAWNTLTCPKECVITPVNEHWTSERMEKEHEEWIKVKSNK